MIDRVQGYLDLLIELGSPELRTAIQAELARTPLEQYKGMTFEEVRVSTVGLPTGPVPTPIDWDFPRAPESTPAVTGTPE